MNIKLSVEYAAWLWFSYAGSKLTFPLAIEFIRAENVKQQICTCF